MIMLSKNGRDYTAYFNSNSTFPNLLLVYYIYIKINYIKFLDSFIKKEKILAEVYFNCF